MDILLGKDRIVVAAVAEIRNLFPQQSLEIRLMRLMTIHAHPAGNRRMHELKSHDLLFTVASETDFGNLVPKQLCALSRMGVMA
jgi:hypothetical protein